MVIGDMPDFDATLSMAYKGLSRTDASQRHIIIISDGDAAPPTPRLLRDLAASKITCSTIAIGYGQHVQEGTLRDIAKQTGGRFYPVRNPSTLPQIFVKESKVVRRPLIVDEPFTPQIYYAPSELLAGLTADEAIPNLGGLVLTSPKPLAQLPLVRTTSDGRDPVLAHWQRGLGRAVAFTSGYWPKWGTQWTQWPKFAKLWAQIVRWTMRHEAPPNFEIYTEVEGHRARIVVEALDKNADYLNFLDLQSRLIHPALGPRSIQFTQAGPGRYEAEFDVEQTGQYIANVAVYREGEYTGSLHAGVSMPFSPELRELATNEAMLRTVAEISGGRWLELDADRDNVFDHDLPPTVSKQPAWDWTVAWLLLPLFLLDVAVRRLASWLALSIAVELVLIVVLLFGAGVIYTHWWGVLGVVLLAELIGWTLRFRYIRPLFDWLTHTVTVLGRTGERSTAALEQLKTARDRARQPHDEGSTPSADPATRFDAGEVTDEPAARNIGDAVGGARAAPGSAKPSAPDDKAADAEPGEATTSRLLRAKRRAKRRSDDADKNDSTS